MDARLPRRRRRAARRRRACRRSCERRSPRRGWYRIRPPCWSARAFPSAASGRRIRAIRSVPVTASGGECVLVARPGSMSGFISCRPGTRRLPKPCFGGDYRSAMRPSRRAASDPEFDFGTALVGLVSLGAFSEIAPSDGVSRHELTRPTRRPMAAAAALLAPVRRVGGLDRGDPGGAAAAGAAPCARRAVLQVGPDQMGRLPDAVGRRAFPVRAGVQAAHFRRSRYPYPAPVLAATLAGIGEIVLPILLVLGLAHALRRAWHPRHDRRHPAYRAGRLGQFPPALGRHGADACRPWRRRACDRPGYRHRPAARLRAADAGGRAVERIVAAAPPWDVPEAFLDFRATKTAISVGRQVRPDAASQLSNSSSA